MRTLTSSDAQPDSAARRPARAGGDQSSDPEGIVEEVVALMAATQAGMIRCWRENALSIDNIHVLFTLRTQGPLTMGGLAHARGVTLPNATCIVDRMEERGLVERVRDVHDRRIVTVRLAAAGEELLQRAEKVKHEVLERVVRALSGADRADFARSIRRFHEAYERLEAAGAFDDLADLEPSGRQARA